MECVFFCCECAATPHNGHLCLLGFAFTGPAYSGRCSSAWKSTAITNHGTWGFCLQITARPHDGFRGLGMHGYIMEWNRFLRLGIHRYNIQWGMILFGWECTATTYSEQCLGWEFIVLTYSGTCCFGWEFTSTTNNGTCFLWLGIHSYKIQWKLFSAQESEQRTMEHVYVKWNSQLQQTTEHDFVWLGHDSHGIQWDVFLWLGIHSYNVQFAIDILG